MKWVGPAFTCPTKGKLFWYGKGFEVSFLGIWFLELLFLTFEFNIDWFVPVFALAWMVV